MRIGRITIRLAAFVAMGLAAGDVVAQYGGAPYGQSNVYPASGSRSGARPTQAVYLAPAGQGSSSYVDASGNPMVVPCQYCASCDDGGCYGPPCDGNYDGCPPDGYCPGGCDGYGDGYGPGYGCPPGGGYGGGYGNCPNCQMGTNPPFEDGAENYSLLPGYRTEQCGPHYFDVRMEAVFLTRDIAFRDNVDFSALNVAGPIVLNSQQLNFEELSPGFRILGRYDLGPLSVLEFGYTGLQDMKSTADAFDPNPVNAQTGNLYSLFTDFVRDPSALPADVTQPNGSFPGTERAIHQRISLDSELHIAEMNYRRYWVGFNPCVSGTLLAGFKFTRLKENFAFESFGEATGDYSEVARNDLAGFQTGGDMWLHLRQGLRAGIEGKAGIYDNHYTLDSGFSSTDQAQAGVFNEHFEKDIPAFMTDASVDVVADLLPSWSLRAGYEVLFINSVVLDGENFNTGSIYSGEPNVLLPPRVPFVNDQGHAFYHGFHVGAEFTW